MMVIFRFVDVRGYVYTTDENAYVITIKWNGEDWHHFTVFQYECMCVCVCLYI